MPLMNRLWRFAGNQLLPGGARARLSILIYHRVVSEPDPLLPDNGHAHLFAQHMAFMAEHFNVLPLSEAVTRLYRHDLPPRAAAITFDDGYADNHDCALPILQRYGLTATFFVANGYLDGGRMWNDSVIECLRRWPGDVCDASGLGLGCHAITTLAERRTAITVLLNQLKYLEPGVRLDTVARLVELSAAALPGDLMMSARQVRALHAAGMEIGAHTVTHPILTRMPLDAVRREMADNTDALAAITGMRPRLFAYPNGKPGQDYAPEHAELCRDFGFAAAVATAWGVATPASDRYQLPRFTPWDRDTTRFGLRLYWNGRNRAA